MTTTNNQETLNNLDILTQAIEIANQVLPRLDIPAGTYTAEGVDKIIRQKFGKSQRQGCDDRVFTTAYDENEKYNVVFRYAHKLQSGMTKLMVLTRNIFQTIVSYEKIAGIKKKDKHIFVKDSPHTKVGSIIVEFPTKQYAKGIADMVNGVNKPKSDCMVLNLKEGMLLGISNNEYIKINERRKVECDAALPEVMFKFKATAMTQIYGRCSVDYYRDRKGAYSILITNEDGWKTCINAPLTDYEQGSVNRMLKVIETDIVITSGYQSERYKNDSNGLNKKQRPTKNFTESDILKEIVSGPEDSNSALPPEQVDEPTANEVPEDSIDKPKEIIEAISTMGQKDQEVNDIPDDTINSEKENLPTSPQDSRKEQKVPHFINRATTKNARKSMNSQGPRIDELSVKNSP